MKLRTYALLIHESNVMCPHVAFSETTKTSVLLAESCVECCSLSILFNLYQVHPVGTVPDARILGGMGWDFGLG